MKFKLSGTEFHNVTQVFIAFFHAVSPSREKRCLRLKWCSEHEPRPGVDGQLWGDPWEDRGIMPPADGPDAHPGTHGTERQSINHEGSLADIKM